MPNAVPDYNGPTAKVPASVPRNYDSASITIDPAELDTAAASMMAHAEEISNSVGNINRMLTQLSLSWTGTSPSSASAEADKINTRWNNVMTQMFGTEGDPGQGVMNATVGFLKTAAANARKTENAVATMWDRFGSLFGQPSTGSGDGAPPPNVTKPVVDDASNPPYHTTSVNETF